ncbi:hypothetical protein LCGC14_2293800 [marine sediment metagenome]|uniref:Uncharacterized protein n=1 Tax=marine sediment metagenome TaxID=412755 RepID=A0A0F9F2Y6_9ZZZZ
MLGDAYIVATCDKCGAEDERIVPVRYTNYDPDTAFYSDNALIDGLIDEGWSQNEDQLACTECTEA